MLTAAAADAATANIGAILSRLVDGELLLWTFHNAPVTSPSAAARRNVDVEVRMLYT